ncbi:hypothetical protein DEU56DRAFT_786750 [Suillus clintonianus]|uniref:uncharacterized protein n=1 Tax=Suillus clintonianus TaxID=1904413 RepID=UPI001B85D659|nr:uncharacterized protein DEU56DRAFT_786750 [Suillus clintonianus]KAG2146833.1 hypothetical protein DEU56DRAFT_786750 [Suillus clintonianus]
MIHASASPPFPESSLSPIMATWNVVGEIANVGGVTSIVQLSLQVILAVNSYASSVAGAETARMSLHNELTSINKILNQIFFLAQHSSPDTSTPENDSSPLDSALKECEKALQDLRDWIPENKRRSLFGAKLAWPFKEADIMKAVVRLERCKSTLSLTISGALLSDMKELKALTKEIHVYAKTEAANIKQASEVEYLLHPLLKRNHYLYFDTSHSAFAPSSTVDMAMVPEERLQMPATTPTITSMRIIHDAIPEWPIDLDFDSDAPITVGDVLRMIHSSLHLQISHSNWALLTQSEETEIARAYTARYRSIPSSAELEASEGVKRVDYLMGKHIFKGLVKAPDADGVCHWKMITSR